MSVVLCLVLLVTGSLGALNPWEKLFVGVPSADEAHKSLKYYTSLPHPAGTKEDYETVLWTQKTLQKLGFNAVIDTQTVFLNYPLHREAGLNEGAFPADPTSNDTRITPTFHGYGASGNVTAEAVYVNYGRLEDYDVLKQNGVSVKGKIAIVRYGQLFRGLKVWLAQLHGAVGCLIYSDPADDGFGRGTPYIDGPWRPEQGVQRGSVQFLSLCPGDPMSPSCTANGTHDYRNFIPKIPSQPLSWGDAQHILKYLQGPVIKDWQGALPFEYHTGPGPVVVNINVQMEYRVLPIWNVIADIPGETEETILIGNHRDAWIFGATDPNSGTAALIEVARGFSVLMKKGWKPKRTIRLCSWDGEEYGLLGSTGYANTHGDWIYDNVAAYLNVDVGVGGTGFGASATHSLDRVIKSVADDIIDPNTSKPLSQVWNGKVDTLGSGSDYTAYIHHYGIPSASFGFFGDAEAGVYHSNYDSLYWMENFGDPDFAYHVACAQYWGVLTLRLADAQILPFNFTDYADWLFVYHNRTVNELAEYGGEGKVDLDGLLDSIVKFKDAATALHSSKEASASDMNDILFKAERQFLGRGLPKRPYYKHVIQAPGLYLGYGSSSFPGIAQTIQAQDWPAANEQVSEAIAQIELATSWLSQ